MTTPNPNTPPVSDSATPPVDEVAKLREFRASIVKGFGLPDDADDAAVLSSLGNVTKERDEHKARADTVVAERNAERLESSIRNAFDRSPLDKRNLPDALALMKPLFHLDDKGRVVTKGGETGEPAGLTPDEFVASRLGSHRPHWMPVSVGGGAKGGGIHHSSLGDTSAFDPRSPNYSVTRQFQLEVERGTTWADAARRKHGGGR